MTQELAESIKNLIKPCNDVLKKLGCKRKSKRGDWFLDTRKDKFNIVLQRQGNGTLIVSPEDSEFPWFGWFNRWYLPIFSWQEIEQKLEGVGYILETNRFYNNSIEQWFARAKISPNYYRYKQNPESFDCVEAKDRQTAVMLAVIKLGKEGNCLAKYIP